MKFQEVKELSDAEIGKRLAEFCEWKTKEFSKQEIREYFARIAYNAEWRYQKDGEWLRCSDLCYSLDAIAEVEEFTIAKYRRYYRCLMTMVINSLKPGEDYLAKRPLIVATASARHRAEACLLALQRS